MNTRLIMKLATLVLGLVFVVMIYSYTSSGSLTRSLNALFGVSNANSINWCADHVVDVKWLATEVPEPLKQKSLSELRRQYCELSTEEIVDLDVDLVEWSPLAESSGAAGHTTVLEWNTQHEVYRTGGMPFKSAKLTQELLQK